MTSGMGRESRRLCPKRHYSFPEVERTFGVGLDLMSLLRAIQRALAARARPVGLVREF